MQRRAIGQLIGRENRGIPETRAQVFARLKREGEEERLAAKFHELDRIDYFVGLHIGQVTRPAALAIVEVTYDYAIRNTRHAVTHIEQFKAGTDYPAIVERAAKIFASGRIQSAYGRGFVVDGTYTGIALRDLLSASTPNGDYALYQIAESGACANCVTTKQDLTLQMQRLLQERRILVAPKIQDAAGLMREMKDYRAQVNDSGSVQFGGGSKQPRVAAISIAVWHAFWWERVLWPGFSEGN